MLLPGKVCALSPKGCHKGFLGLVGLLCIIITMIFLLTKPTEKKKKSQETQDGTFFPLKGGSFQINDSFKLIRWLTSGRDANDVELSMLFSEVYRRWEQ